MSGGESPLPVEGDHFGGHRRHRLSDPALLLRPVSPAHPGDTRCLPAGVSLDRGELVDRDVELVARCVGDDQVLALDPHHRPGDEALEPADAVLVMNDVVTLDQVLQLLSCRGGGTPGAPVGPPPARDLGLAENRHPQLVRDEAVVDADRMTADLGFTRLSSRSMTKPSSARTRATRSAAGSPSMAMTVATPAAASLASARATDSGSPGVASRERMVNTRSSGPVGAEGMRR